MAAPQGQRTSLLMPLAVTAPGAMGITEELSMAGGEVTNWLFEAQNAVYNDDGLLGPREHFKKINYPVAGVPKLNTNGFDVTYAANRYFVSVDKNIYTQFGEPLYSMSFSTDDGMVQPTTPVDTYIWKAVYMGNANSAKAGIYFFSDGQTPLFYDNGFKFSQINTGPKFGIAHSAFGRLWAISFQSNVLKWSNLLNGKDWTTAGTGSLDINHYLGQGEVATAIADFNNYLVIFTNKSILIFENPFNVSVDTAGSLTDTNIMKLKEKIDGVGCVGMNAWTSVGEELFFVSYGGLYKMSRILSDNGSNPIGVVCPQINRTLVDSLKLFAFSPTNNHTVRLNYHPLFGFITLETGHIIHGTFLIWLTRPIGNNSFAVTQWGNISKDRITGVTKGYASLKNTQLYGIYSVKGSSTVNSGRALTAVVLGIDDAGNRTGFCGVATYGHYDYNPQTQPVAEDGFDFRLTSAWLDFGNQAAPQEKMPKDLKLIYRQPRGPFVNSANAAQYTGYAPTSLEGEFTLKFDYDENKKVHKFTAELQTTRDDNGFDSYWPSNVKTTPIPLSGSGSLVQWGIYAFINNLAHEDFAVQRAGFQTKLGRINQGI